MLCCFFFFKKKEVEAVELTDEEKAAEKLRIQYEQEQSDLCMALETTFSGAQTIQIDNLFPVRKEDFQELNNALSKKFQSFNKSAEYYHFVEQHIRNICASSKYFLKIRTVLKTNDTSSTSRNFERKSFLTFSKHSQILLVTSAELKNIRLTVSNLCSEKQKLENAEKSKKVKPKSKATLKLKNEVSFYESYFVQRVR